MKPQWTYLESSRLEPHPDLGRPRPQPFNQDPISLLAPCLHGSDVGWGVIGQVLELDNPMKKSQIDRTYHHSSSYNSEIHFACFCYHDGISHVLIRMSWLTIILWWKNQQNYTEETTPHTERYPSFSSFLLLLLLKEFRTWILQKTFLWESILFQLITILFIADGSL